MQNTRWILQNGRRALRVALAGGLCCCGWGCHQHFYYYGNPPGMAQGCPPGTTIMPSGVTTTGPVCEVPVEGSSSNVLRSTTVSDGKNSRVVVSTPSNGIASRFGWKASDPDSVPAITQVEGGIQSSTVK